MGIYRKIHQQMWSDEKFRSYSKQLPSAQALWIYLLVGPQTGMIPGLYRASKVGLADELEWDVAEFDRCFQEIERAGAVQADWRSRLIWVPNAINHNRPDNPKVVIAWARAFEMLPE